MFFIDQRSLAKLWNEKNGKVEIELCEATYKDEIGWAAHVITNDGRARLINARSEIRYWRQLNSAAKELSRLLPGLQFFKVVLGQQEHHTPPKKA